MLRKALKVVDVFSLPNVQSLQTLPINHEDHLCFSCFECKELDPTTMKFCFDLCKARMKALYDQVSFLGGWNDDKKREELSHSSGRFVVATHCNAPVGYLLFQFEYEERRLIAYIYELHVVEKWARNGIGKHLIRILRNTCESVGAKQIMLTCLKVNVEALAFYGRINFVEDHTSPGLCGDSDANYIILSYFLEDDTAI